MAIKKLAIFILIAATLAMHTSASLQTYTVGDNKGWAPGVDFNGWAGKNFLIGDKLVFKYQAGKFNVIEVDERSFVECIVPPDPKKALTSGEDTINLDTPRTFFFICGTENGKYCRNDNMKMKINIPGELKSAGPTGPKEYVVGDDKGWAVGVDYKAWLEGKEINVGDKLVFKYQVGTQNVYKVHESLYNDCIIPTPDQPLTTGQDYVSIPGPGEFGFLSSVDNNCQKGVKLLIKVECPLKKKVQGGRKLVPPKL